MVIINQKKTRGFTLIELLVVTSIFLLVFVFTIRGLRDNRRLEEFRLSTEQVASEIRKAQTMAIAGVSSAILENAAYGLYFNEEQSGQYLIFVDANATNTYEAEEDTVLSTLTFPNNISLSNVGPEPLTSLSIVFVPPQPTIYINGQAVIAEAAIYLRRSNVADKEGQIKINRLTGRVTADLTNL